MPRIWDGKDVAVSPGGLASVFTNKPVEIRMTEEAARRLSFALASMAAVRKAQGHADAARTYFSRVVKEHPDSPEAAAAGKALAPS